MATIKLYRISASYTRDGQVLDCSQAEILGDAYGVTYATREEAESIAEDMQEEVEDYNLDPSTTYSVDEVTVSISAVDAAADDDDITVSADVRVDGCTRKTVWSARPRHTAAGVDGIEPSGDSPDCWIDGDLAATLGETCAIAIGEYVLASARRAPTQRGMEVRS